MKNSLIPQVLIGKAAQVSGMSTASIRFYEKNGLLSPAARSGNGYRNYSAQDIDRLRQIRTCRSLGMSLYEIRQLLNVPAEAPKGCKITAQILQQHLQHIENRVSELHEMKSRLNELMALCKHDPNAACPAQLAVKEPTPLVDHPANTCLRHV